MKKFFLFLCVMFFAISGCGRADRSPTAIKIGRIEFSAQEFQQEFEDSVYVARGDEGKKEFLENFILKKLMLKEAEAAGLDKEAQFLLEIQHFWERTLLKDLLKRKTQQLAGDVFVSDDEISDYYKRHKVGQFSGKELSQVYADIKWLLLREKQSLAVADWVESLKTECAVQVNNNLLGIEK